MSSSPLSPPFQVVATRTGDECILSLAGEFDLAAVDAIRPEIERAIRSDATSIIFDLSQLEFIDSSGINALLEADAQSRADSNRVSFRGPLREQVRAVLHVTELDHRFKLD